MVIGSNLKWAAGAALAIAMILGGYGLYQHGKTVATLECGEAQAKVIKKAVEDAKAEWESTQTITSNGIKNVNSTQDQIRVIRETRIETIQSPNCTDLGSDFAGVYNATIGAIKSGATPNRNVSTAKVPATPIDGNAN